MNERILFILGNAHRGGTERQTVRLGTELALRGASVMFIFLREGGPLLGDLKKSGIPYEVVGINARKKPLTLMKILKLWKIIRTYDPQVLHALLPENIIFGVLVGRSAAPGALTFAGIRGFNPSTNFLSVALLKFALKKSDRILINSQDLVDELRLGKPFESKIILFTNGVDIDPHFDKLPQFELKRAVVIANFYPYKGQEVVLKALEEFHLNLKISFFGNGPTLENVKKSSIDTNLEQFVVFHGNVEIEYRTLREYDFAIHPSFREGMSNAILEELACGLPVIASDIPQNKVLVQDEYNGLIYKAGDSEDLGKAIQRLLDDPDLLERLKENTKMSVSAYSWSNKVNEYENIVHQSASDWSSIK